MAEQRYTHVRHEFEPVFDKESRILILGTFPSVKSREQQFYYGHPQNRFWKVLAQVFQEEAVPQSVEEKKCFLLEKHIAIWDVIAECDIVGSSDSSIRHVVPTDLNRILKEAPIRKIYGNGQKACSLYRKYAFAETQREMIPLPSTSPANAAWNMERLQEQWKQIRIWTNKTMQIHEIGQV